MNFEFEPKRIKFMKYELNEDKTVEFTIENGIIVDVNVIEKSVAEKKISEMKEYDDTVKKILDIMSKDKELNEYVRNRREEICKNILQNDREWVVSPEEEKGAIEEFLKQHQEAYSTNDNANCAKCGNHGNK